MKRGLVCLVLTVVFVVTIASHARADRDRYENLFNKSGFIQSWTGEKCWYDQTYQETNPHFMPEKFKETTYHELRTITFRDPACMADNDINRISIRKVVSRWFLGTYFRKDAWFRNNKIHRPKIESRGECIRSLKYPSKGIVLDYFTADGNIAKVLHMTSTLGCLDNVISGDALEVKECNILKANRTKMYRHRYIKKAGAWIIPKGNIICVDEIDRSGGELWYKVQVMKTNTLDRSKHIPGWIDSRSIMEHGVTLAD